MAGDNSFAFAGWRHRAAQFFFLLITLSLPLFSIPCQKGICSSPMEVVALHLLSIHVDETIVKAMLYPAALYATVERIVADSESFSFPDWNNLLKDMKIIPVALDKGHRSPCLGFLIGCYLCIVGAIVSIFGPTILGLCGMLTILWYIYRDGGTTKDIFLLPTFTIALFCAFAGLKWFGKTSESSTFGDSSSSLAERTKKQK